MTLQGWVSASEHALCTSATPGLRLSGNTFWLEKAEKLAEVCERKIDSVIGRIV